MHSYEPGAGHRLAHDPLNAIVAPRPIGWISTLSSDGVRNLAPFSFFNLFSYRPPIVGFTTTRWKDSVANVQATGEFVWNLATRPQGEAMNATSAEVAAEIDEFELAGLAGVPSTLVAPPRVAGAPVAFECRLTQLINLRDARGEATEGWVALGEVVMVHITEELVANGVYDTVAARPIVRGGGPVDYFEIREDARFGMRRP
ncbi:flavin reductase family protein [Microbacterium sp. ASV49]|uniref:Flavin reductase family protein n=1 Tax=Microbacterium candidum TaxID=3041922 RepID=A0ABT7N2D9_9MICO|nr:flavin reductase family protein [Microbacterium sp. ASV49]MDL9980852.1 flavin reductase family protein [Microbacterium sp. ASV49]